MYSTDLVQSHGFFERAQEPPTPCQVGPSQFFSEPPCPAQPCVFRFLTVPTCHLDSHSGPTVKTPTVRRDLYTVDRSGRLCMAATWSVDTAARLERSVSFAAGATDLHRSKIMFLVFLLCFSFGAGVRVSPRRMRMTASLLTTFNCTVSRGV